MDCWLVALAVSLSGNPALCHGDRSDGILGVCTVIFGWLALKRWWHYHLRINRFIMVALGFAAIMCIQCVTSEDWPLATMIGFLCRLGIGFAVVFVVRDFPEKFVVVMYYSCLLSIPFYLMSVLWGLAGVDLIGVFSPVDHLISPEKGFNIGVYNFLAYGIVPEYSNPSPFRNSSYLWEPGAFGAYLLLAIAFLGLLRERVDRRRYWRTLSVLVAAVLTTLSTTAYVLLPLAAALHLGEVKWTVKGARVAFAGFGVAAISGLLLLRLDFVGGKMEQEYQAVKYGEGTWEYTRLGAVLHDWQYIRKNPLFGVGPANRNRYSLDKGESAGKLGNGLSDFTVKYGIMGMAIYVLSVVVGVHRWTGFSLMKTALFVVVLLLQLNGEILLNHPLYLGLMFMCMGDRRAERDCAPRLGWLQRRKTILAHRVSYLHGRS